MGLRIDYRVLIREESRLDSSTPDPNLKHPAVHDFSATTALEHCAFEVVFPKGAALFVYHDSVALEVALDRVDRGTMTIICSQYCSLTSLGDSRRHILDLQSKVPRPRTLLRKL